MRTKQKLRLLMTLLLCAALGQVWANEIVAYTFTTPKGESDYTKFKDITIDGVEWNVPGNQYQDGVLRLGGKNLDGVDRVITGKGSLADAITKITVNHSGTTSDKVIVNSVKVTVASDADFSNVIETITLTPTIEKNVSGNFDFTPSSGSWSDNSFYKFTFNISNSDGSNYAFVLNSIVFYKDDGNTDPIDPTVTLTTTDIKVGETTNITFPSNLSEVIFDSNNENVATVDDNGKITGVGAGTATISMMWDGDDNYNEGETEFTVNVSKNDATVSLSTNTLKVGKTATISYPEDLTSILFESNNVNVATVSETGVITGVSAGEATITVVWGDNKYNDGETKFTITVEMKTASLEIGNTTLAIPGMGISETTISSVPEDLVFTLSSSNEKYATVSGNKITAVKAGNATITATWEEQTVGDYVYEGGERTFDITIIEPEDGYYDFTNLVLDYGSGITRSDNSSEYVEKESTWTAGNVTMVVDGKYRWWLTDGTLRIFNPTDNSTTLTFTTIPNCMITKIEVSGTNRSSLGSEDDLYNDNDGTWEGYASQVVLYRDGNDTPQIKTIKVTYEAQPSPFTLDIIPEGSDGRYYYSTMSNIGPGNYIVPSNVMVSTIIVNEKRRIENTEVFSEGESFPGYGAYLVTADYPGQFTFEVSEIIEPIELLGENQLYPAIKGQYIAGPEKDVEYSFYKLSLNSESELNSIGFYWGAEGGNSFMFENDNKAFLAIPMTDGVRLASSISFGGGDADNIRSISSAIPQNGSAYTLVGIRMDGKVMPKGVYIVNGKKIVVK